jgi:hypothetical protein
MAERFVILVWVRRRWEGSEDWLRHADRVCERYSLTI